MNVARSICTTLSCARFERVFPLLSDSKFPINPPMTGELVAARLKAYESLTEILRAMMTIGCYWGTDEQSLLWLRVLGRVAGTKCSWNGLVLLIGLRLYPALLLLYSGGLASLAAGNYGIFAALLTGP